MLAAKNVNTAQEMKMRMTLAALAATLVSAASLAAMAQAAPAATGDENKYEIVLVDPVDDKDIDPKLDHDVEIEHDEKDLPCFPVTTKPTEGLQVRIAFHGKDPRAGDATVVTPGACLELPVGKHGQLRGCVMSDKKCHVVRDLGKFTVTRLTKPPEQKKIRPGGKVHTSRKKAALKPLPHPLDVAGGVCYDSTTFDCVGEEGVKQSGKCNAFVASVIYCPSPGRVLLGSATPDPKSSDRDDAQDRRMDGIEDRVGDVEGHVASAEGVDGPAVLSVGPSAPPLGPTALSVSDDPCVRARLKSRFFVPTRSAKERYVAAERECDVAHRQRTGTSSH